jgi:uncharacterized membrane protein YiaA
MGLAATTTVITDLLLHNNSNHTYHKCWKSLVFCHPILLLKLGHYNQQCCQMLWAHNVLSSHQGWQIPHQQTVPSPNKVQPPPQLLWKLWKLWERERESELMNYSLQKTENIVTDFLMQVGVFYTPASLLSENIAQVIFSISIFCYSDLQEYQPHELQCFVKKKLLP